MFYPPPHLTFMLLLLRRLTRETPFAPFAQAWARVLFLQVLDGRHTAQYETKGQIPTGWAAVHLMLHDISRDLINYADERFRTNLLICRLMREAFEQKLPLLQLRSACAMLIDRELIIDGDAFSAMRISMQLHEDHLAGDILLDAIDELTEGLLDAAISSI